MRNKNLSKLFLLIEEEVGSAYEIGHAHGQNAFRKPAERGNEGWGKSSDLIKKELRKYLSGIKVPIKTTKHARNNKG